MGSLYVETLKTWRIILNHLFNFTET